MRRPPSSRMSRSAAPGPDADGQRDLPFDSGRVELRGPALRVRAPDRLQPALRVVRHGLRLRRGALDRGRRGGGRRGGLRLSAGGDHGRRAAAAARRLSVDEPAARGGQDGAARDGRPDRHLGRARRGRQGAGRQVSRQRRGRAQRVGQPGAPRGARRGEVRDPRPGRLRVRARRPAPAWAGAPLRRRAAVARAPGHGPAASWPPGRSPTGSRCGSRCSSTSTCGATTPAACEPGARSP